MKYENIATPKSRINAQMKHSISFSGCKSPKPTVERDVKAKYEATIAL